MPTTHRRTPTAVHRAQWRDERQAKLADLHTRIVERVATLTDGDRWRAWLGFAARFHTYSFANTIAIWLQRPDATWVAGIKRWNAMGRHVRKGERGIAILAPVTSRAQPTDPAPTREPDPATVGAPPGPAGPPGSVTPSDPNTTGAPVIGDVDQGKPAGRILRGFKIVTVFDISQTEGKPIEPPPRPGRADLDARLLTGQAPAGVWDALVGIATDHRYRVERGDCGGANGFIRWADRLIKVRADVDEAQAVKTLIHELGHLLLHEPSNFAGGSTVRCRGEQEVEAESVAFLVAAHAGLDTSDYTFGYVAGWAERAVAATGKPPHEIVQATGARVVQAAATLTTTLDDALGYGEPVVPESLAQRVAAGTDAAARLRADTAGTTPRTGRADSSHPGGHAFRRPAPTAAIPPAPGTAPAPGPARRRHR